MTIEVTECKVKSILTRTSGFLEPVASHSINPYGGCSFGKSLCGVPCYAQFQARNLRRGWGSFLEVRVNAPLVYMEQYESEQRWARKFHGRFGIFMSSSTDPFVPQEDRFQVTRQLIEAMVHMPPDQLIVQTHTDRVKNYVPLYRKLSSRCDLRFHISIETYRPRLPGLPPAPSSVQARFDAAALLKSTGLRVVITVSPLLPIEHPKAFFERISAVADAVVIDHFIEGDGTPTGSRTKRTALPLIMSEMDPSSVSLEYRDRMVAIAQHVMPGRVGVNKNGFAGRF